MTRPRYPSDDRTRQRKAERRQHHQQPRPSGPDLRLRRRSQVDPDDYGHPMSCVRSEP